MYQGLEDPELGQSLAQWHIYIPAKGKMPEHGLEQDPLNYQHRQVERCINLLLWFPS